MRRRDRQPQRLTIGLQIIIAGVHEWRQRAAGDVGRVRPTILSDEGDGPIGQVQRDGPPDITDDERR